MAVNKNRNMHRIKALAEDYAEMELEQLVLTTRLMLRRQERGVTSEEVVTEQVLRAELKSRRKFLERSRCQGAYFPSMERAIETLKDLEAKFGPDL